MSTSLLGRGIEGVCAEIGACYLAITDRNHHAASDDGSGEGELDDDEEAAHNGTTNDIFAWCEEALDACESKAMPPKVKGLRWELSSVRKVRDFLYEQVQQI